MRIRIDIDVPEEFLAEEYDALVADGYKGSREQHRAEQVGQALDYARGWLGETATFTAEEVRDG